MGWVALGAAAISAYGASRQASAGRRAANSQEQIAREQLQFAREGRDRGWRYLDLFDERMLPLLDEAIAEARRNVDPDYAAISADNAATHAAMRGAQERDLRRFGISPADGISLAERRKSASAEATSHVLARNTARRDARGQRLANLAGAFNLGGSIANLGTSLSGGSMAAFNAGSNTLGQAADRRADANANAYNAYGQALGTAFGAWQANRGGGQSYGMPNYGGQYSNNGTYVGVGSTNYGAPGSTMNTGYGVDVTNWRSTGKAKTDIEEVDTGAALDATLDSPTVSYRYRDGQGPAGRYFGVVAEDASPTFSNGQSVNIVNQVGMLQGAVQELARRQGMPTRRSGWAGAAGRAPMMERTAYGVGDGFEAPEPPDDGSDVAPGKDPGGAKDVYVQQPRGAGGTGKSGMGGVTQAAAPRANGRAGGFWNSPAARVLFPGIVGARNMVQSFRDWRADRRGDFGPPQRLAGNRPTGGGSGDRGGTSYGVGPRGADRRDGGSISTLGLSNRAGLRSDGFTFNEHAHAV